MPFLGAMRAKGFVSVPEASSIQPWDMTAVVASLDDAVAIVGSSVVLATLFLPVGIGTDSGTR